MKIHAVQQQSLEWMLLRSGKPTASEFHNLLTPEFKVRTGQMPKTYLHKKLAEAWQGGPLVEFNSFDAEQGQFLETEAIPWFELEHNTTVERVGFITTDCGRIGCSPDGLLGDDCGIEIKCPAIHTHVSYLLNGGELPDEYAAQVHGSLYVTGFPSWRFLSYRRRLPPLLLEIERDEEIQDKIHDALSAFLADFDDGWKRLCDLNGGPPKRMQPRPVTSPAPETFAELIP